LAAAWWPLPLVAEGLLAEEIDAVNIAAVISGELAAATRRAAELAEASLRAEGEAPPEPYAVLVLGSAGRGESLLALDQDNAIVFRSGEPNGPQDRYFARLGARLADTLDAVGIPYCKGGVMAREPAWRGSVETWHARIRQWLSRSSPEDLLSVDIFFDAEAVHGDAQLAADIIADAHSGASQAPQFIKVLAAASPNPASPFGLLGGFNTEGGRIDLKRAALLPIVSSTRVLAMRHGIAERSTQERLRRLRELGKGGEADLEAIMSAHRVVVAAILRQQVRDIHAGIAPSSRIAIAPLSRRERDLIRTALKVVPRLDELVRDLLF
jgi:DNA polymerase-3 subunit epsilon/CBS domain-containing protein